MSELAISNFMRQDVVKSRFAEIIGERNTSAYIASVLLAVANDQSGLLKQSTPESIYTSAMRAASLRLSVDPSTGQAYLVPFRNKGVLNATLIVGYKGLYDMAVRTGRYRYINVGKVYEGEEIIEDRLSGFHKIGGHKKSSTVAGWLGAFEMTNGYAKTMYMTVGEIHEHAKKFSQGYANAKGQWQTSPESMEKKTVLRLLLRRWGYLDPSDAAVVDQVDEENNGVEIVDVITGEILPAGSQLTGTEEETMGELGFGDDDVSQPAAPAQDTQAMSRPYPPEVVKQKIASFVEIFEKSGEKPTAGQRSIVPVNLEQCFAPDPNAEQMRHSVTKYLIGKTSTNDFTDAEVLAIRKWLNVQKDSGGEWLPDPMAEKEAGLVWRAANIEAGQGDLFNA